MFYNDDDVGFSFSVACVRSYFSENFEFGGFLLALIHGVLLEPGFITKEPETKLNSTL